MPFCDRKAGILLPAQQFRALMFEAVTHGSVDVPALKGPRAPAGGAGPEHDMRTRYNQPSIQRDGVPLCIQPSHLHLLSSAQTTIQQYASTLLFMVIDCYR